MAGKLVIKEYEYGDGARIVVLEGNEIMVEVDACTLETTEELHELAQWLDAKATEIATKFATGEF
jgi:hypothetical protein